MSAFESPRRSAAAILLVKSVHTVIFLGMAFCVFHTLYAGLTGRISALTMVSIAVIIFEGLVLLVNHGRCPPTHASQRSALLGGAPQSHPSRAKVGGRGCPLTDLAESLGSEHGSVSDIFLPAWVTPRIPLVFSTLFAIGLVGIGLHRLGLLR